MKNKKIEDLILSDDILFYAIFKDDASLAHEFLEALLEINLNEECSLLMQSHEGCELSKASVLDMKLKNKNIVFNVEVQNEERNFPPKRIRLIESNLTVSLSEKGIEYEEIVDVIIIVICTSSKRRKHYYELVKEVDNKLYDDGSKVLYFYTKSKNIPDTLQGALLKYFNGEISDYPLIKKLENKRKQILKNKEIRSMMIYQLTKEYQDIRKGKLEGIEQGKLEGAIELIKSLKEFNIDNNEIFRRVKELLNVSDEKIEKLINE